jgi:hypothetical protein
VGRHFARDRGGLLLAIFPRTQEILKLVFGQRPF